MFNNLKLALKVAKYAVNIKMVLESVYNVINKLDPILDAVEKQTADSKETKLGKVVVKYLPFVRTAIEKIKDVITKFGPLVGFETVVYGQADEDSVEALEAALKELDAALNTIKKD
jgi:predicted DNA repair protein MutK